MLSSRLATLVEMDTVLSVEDVYQLLEVINVDAHNHRIVRAAAEATKRK